MPKKRGTASNKLCESCQRICKQAANAIVARCPSYFPDPLALVRRKDPWKQLEFRF